MTKENTMSQHDPKQTLERTVLCQHLVIIIISNKLMATVHCIT